MDAFIVIDGKTNTVGSGVTLETAFRSLGFIPDSYLFLIGGRPVPMTRVLSDGDEVSAVRIASGG